MPKLPTIKTNKKYPFIFNNGRLRNHWHTMGRTTKSANLVQHIDEPYVALNEKDIKKYNLEENQLVNVYNDLSSITLRLKKDNKLKPNNCFSPIHWSDTYSSNASINHLIHSNKDPISGQPEFKHSVVNIKSSNIKLHGFIYSFHKITKDKLNNFDFWVEIKLANHYRYEIAMKDDIMDFRKYINNINIPINNQKLFFTDLIKKDYRYIHLDNNILDFVLFFKKEYSFLPPRKYISTLFDSNNYQKILSNENDYEDKGKVICTCFGIGEKTIIKAIKDNNLLEVEEVTTLLKAGGKCGSCLPEIKCCFD